MDAQHWVMALIGVAGLTLFGWLRSERGGRAWFPPHSQNVPKLVCVVGPALSVLALAGGILPLVDSVTPVKVVVVIVVIAALVLGVVGVLTLPRWAMPGWLRRRVDGAAGQGRPDR